METNLLITYPVNPAAAPGGKGHGGRSSPHDAADGGASGRFGAATAEAAARSSSAKALATPRDALHFRVQMETLPGPGSVAPFVAQQIGQLWIAPDARIDSFHAAAAYERANDAVDQYIAAAIDRPVTA